jgi:hypothetical protein
MNPVCSCIYCKEVKSVKGIHTHVERSHFGSTKYSNGHNGKYNTKEFITKLKQSISQKNDTRLGEFKNFLVNCFKCKKVFSVLERELQFPLKEKYFCTRVCANSRTITDDQKKKVSSKLTGKPYVEPIKVNTICIVCNNPFTYIKHYTKKDKLFCSKTCTTRKSAELKRLQRPALINYRADCAFKFNLSDFPDEFNFSLIEQCGWYRPKNRGNNLTGVSRDHMISVRYGFDNNIPTEHLSHPANCKLLQHGKNVSKGTKNSITYDELLIRIKEWDEKYK